LSIYFITMEEIQIFYIKNMVCPRCIKVVEEEFEKIGLQIESIKLGEVVIVGKISEQQSDQINNTLLENGFELISDKKSRLIDKIKTEIINIIHYNKEITSSLNLSEYLAIEVGADYSFLSSLFSSVEGTTIEKYFILQKIEKVKELIVYNELSLSEIAYKLNFSSPQHLSNQFKRITGLSPSHFKNLKEIPRKPLDNV